MGHGERLRRPALIIAVVVLAGLALLLMFLNSALVFYDTPSEVLTGKVPHDEDVRLGGWVKNGSLAREADGLTLRFVLTDDTHEIEVHFRGVAPDLFREGQGAVVQGRMSKEGIFVATQMLAKHDENYLPAERGQ